MKYYLFKLPRKLGDKEIEILKFEPTEFMLEQKAMKHGPILVITEEELLKEKQEDLNI